MNENENPELILKEAGYQEAFVLINGTLYCESYPTWNCHISKVRNKIVLPDFKTGINHYGITTQCGLRGCLVIENPPLDDY